MPSETIPTASSRVTKASIYGSELEAFGRLVFDRLSVEASQNPRFEGYVSEDLGPESLQRLTTELFSHSRHIALSGNLWQSSMNLNRVFANATRLGVKPFGTGAEEGLKTGIKMPLTVAWAAMDNREGGRSCWRELAGLLRDPQIHSILTRLAFANNGALGPDSSSPSFSSPFSYHYSDDEVGIVGRSSSGEIALSKAIKRHLDAARPISTDTVRQTGMVGPPNGVYQDGCPMRRRHNNNPENLITYGAKTVSMIIETSLGEPKESRWLARRAWLQRNS